MNKEYEYSFKVDNLDELVEFLINNNYELKDKYDQTRIIYKNNSSVMARITSNKYEDREDKVLDFKDDDLSDRLVKVRRESSPLTIDDKNIEFVNSLLEMLGYEEKVVLNRNRLVYSKDDVIFEIDKYDNDIVVSIEGEKNNVDKTYEKMFKIISK